MRVLVMGLGRHGGGVAVCRWFAGQGAQVVAHDNRRLEDLGGAVEEVEALGVQVKLGPHDEGDFTSCDLLVVNPAVPFDHVLVERARSHGVGIATELGLTLRHLKGPVVAVTGTKGKSTTTALTAAMLRASGLEVEMGGNIGRSLLNETPRMGADTLAVLEISSFQLHWLEHDLLAPVAAVITNVTGDHLDRHKTLEHYEKTKGRLAAAVPPGGTLVLRRGDAACERYAATARGRVIWFGGGLPSPVPLGGLRLIGAHNQDNAAAAAYAALAAGATVEGCLEALASFRPLPHRLETVAERQGILCVDDSIATTPEAAATALGAFDRPVVLLAGGRDKGNDWAPLLRAAGRAKAVVAYGEAGPALNRALPRAQYEREFDRAVRVALSLASPGDVLLLSPGFASFDQFPGFEVRGDRFRELVLTA